MVVAYISYKSVKCMHLKFSSWYSLTETSFMSCRPPKILRKLLTNADGYDGCAMTGDETWTSVVAESTAQQWTVVQGLESGVTYEVKVIAGDDDAYCPEMQTPVRRVHIDLKRGTFIYSHRT